MRNAASPRGSAIVFGTLLALFGSLIAYAGFREYGFGGPFGPGLALAAVGVGLAGATFRYPAVDVMRVFGGIVAGVLGVGLVAGGLVGAALRGPALLPLVPMGFVCLVAAAFCFDVPRRLQAAGPLGEDGASRMLGGSAAIYAGLAIAGQVMTDPSGMSPGVSLWVGVAAGGVFFLAGVLIVAGARQGLLGPLAVALLLSLFAALALVLFPPGGIVVAFLAVLGWLEVARTIHHRVTGRDPFAGMSDERRLGIGCLVFLALAPWSASCSGSPRGRGARRAAGRALPRSVPGSASTSGGPQAGAGAFCLRPASAAATAPQKAPTTMVNQTQKVSCGTRPIKTHLANAFMPGGKPGGATS